MIDTRNYVPILRWKEAERNALAQLPGNHSAFLTPLIELVPDNFIHVDKKGHTTKLNNTVVTNKVAAQIFQSWDGRPFFLDLYNLPKEILSPGSNHPLFLLGQYASNLGLRLVPVIGIDRDHDYTSAVVAVLGMFRQGACVRLTITDVTRPDLSQALRSVISTLKLGFEDIDLLIDYQIIESNAPTLDVVSGLIPNLHEWRSFIVAGGAFPKDLSDLAKNQKHILPRTDWVNWRNQVTSKIPLLRVPIYGDYSIQHAKYSRHIGHLRYSASIRYTTDENWIIMRGEDVFNPNGPRFKQYPDWAILLCNLPEYCGENYSSGDKYIKDMSLQSAVTGDASSWLQAGINHHMTFVVRQLANLFGPSIAASP